MRLVFGPARRWPSRLLPGSGRIVSPRGRPGGQDGEAVVFEEAIDRCETGRAQPGEVVGHAGAAVVGHPRPRRVQLRCIAAERSRLRGPDALVEGIERWGAAADLL